MRRWFCIITFQPQDIHLSGRVEFYKANIEEESLFAFLKEHEVVRHTPLLFLRTFMCTFMLPMTGSALSAFQSRRWLPASWAGLDLSKKIVCVAASGQCAPRCAEQPSLPAHCCHLSATHLPACYHTFVWSTIPRCPNTPPLHTLVAGLPAALTDLLSTHRLMMLTDTRSDAH